MPHIETSAKENTNVNEMFMSLIKRLSEKYLHVHQTEGKT